MEKYLVKFIDGKKDIYRPLLSRRLKTFKTCRLRCRDGQKGEEYINYKGGEYINVFENHFHKVVSKGVTPDIICAEEIYKLKEDYVLYYEKI